MSEKDVSQLHTKQSEVFQAPDSHSQKREIAGLDGSLPGGT